MLAEKQITFESNSTRYTEINNAKTNLIDLQSKLDKIRSESFIKGILWAESYYKLDTGIDFNSTYEWIKNEVITMSDQVNNVLQRINEIDTKYDGKIEKANDTMNTIKEDVSNVKQQLAVIATKIDTITTTLNDIKEDKKSFKNTFTLPFILALVLLFISSIPKLIEIIKKLS